LDLDDPQPSFALLRYVAETGGDKVTGDLAISWLDEQVRCGLTLPPDQEAWLLEMLGQGGHPAWEPGFRFWMFNSSFNTLQHGSQREAFTALLRRMALADSELTLRLYALQHLGLMHEVGHLTDTQAEEIHGDLQGLATAPDSQVAGTAVALLTAWGGVDGGSNAEALDHALALAGDNQRAIGVRVTALHAAGVGGLALARALAANPAEPVPVRKAAIACIGSFGNEADCWDLEKLAAQSSRLAQAATPALRSIRYRVTAPAGPQPVPF